MPLVAATADGSRATVACPSTTVVDTSRTCRQRVKRRTATTPTPTHRSASPAPLGRSLGLISDNRQRRLRPVRLVDARFLGVQPVAPFELDLRPAVASVPLP